jgi:hypothetical protein
LDVEKGKEKTIDA